MNKKDFFTGLLTGACVIGTVGAVLIIVLFVR